MGRRILPLIALLAFTPAVPAQVGAPTGRHLVPFRDDAELSRYLLSLAQSRARVREKAIALAQQQGNCAQSSSSARRARRNGGGAASSSSTVVVGTVHDVTGSALSGVSLRLDDGRPAYTDAGGRYRLPVDAPALPRTKRATLTARRIGMTPRTQPIRLEAGDSVTVRFTLCAQQAMLEAVVTTGYGLSGATASTSAQSITINQDARVDDGGIV